jgi:hypothetical protein
MQHVVALSRFVTRTFFVTNSCESKVQVQWDIASRSAGCVPLRSRVDPRTQACFRHIRAQK